MTQDNQNIEVRIHIKLKHLFLGEKSIWLHYKKRINLYLRKMAYILHCSFEVVIKAG